MAGRPRGRPEKATPEIKQLISDIYVDLSQNGERPYVEDVYKMLGENLAELKKPLTLAKSTVRRIMQELKDEAGRTQEQEAELDQSWSIGASITLGIPPDITPTLLEIRRWCILTGQSLSVREARWVAYLQHTSRMEPKTTDTRIAALHHFACRYALREKASKLLGKASVDTSDLDIGRMQWDSWVRQTAKQTGAIPTKEANKVMDTLGEDWLQLYHAKIKERGQVPELTLQPWLWLTNTSPELAVDSMLDIDLPPSITPANLDGQGQEIYALWIWHLSKGPKWDRLAKQERDFMAATLKAEIYGHQLELQIAREKAIQDYADPFAYFSHIQKLEDWKIPASYLKTFGYDTDGPNKPHEIEAPEQKGDVNG